MRTVLGMAIFVIGLCGCLPSSQTPTAADLQWAQAARPANAQLAERYERSCMACHVVAASDAPLTGFAPHWKRRIAQGADQMLRHAQDGLNAMPARGQCNDCSPDDLRALTEFMSTKAGQ